MPTGFLSGYANAQEAGRSLASPVIQFIACLIVVSSMYSVAYA